MPRKIPQTEDDFLDAQREAIRRVREMQTRARHTLESAGMHIEPTPTPQPRIVPISEHATQIERDAFERSQPVIPHIEEPAQNRHEPVQNHHEQVHKEKPIQSPLEDGFHIPFISDIINGGIPSMPIKIFDISLDNEQIIILIVLYVLYIDKADPYLMVALGYVLL